MTRESSVLIRLLFAILTAVIVAPAQEQQQTLPASGEPSQAQTAPQPVWSAEQLDNIVAPIALYPDPLLGQILVASTYPLEVVEAHQWLQRNKHLRGQALVDAAKQQSWDPSIQALVAVPDALAKLNQDIRWTTDLGNAFLSQQADVMSAVQRMRGRAQEKGHLSSTPQQTVRVEEEAGRQVIVIQPADPQVIYVPAYDPVYVWGPPIYGYYPPLYYPSFGFGFGIGFNLGFCFGGWGGWGFWGWGPSWFSHSVYVNNYFFHHHGFHHPYRGDFRGRQAWVHDPGHRMRVPYGNAQVAQRFGGHSMAPRNSFGAGAGPRGGASPNAGRTEGGFPGRTGEQGYRSASSQTQRYQNPTRQRYQSTPQTQSSSYRGTPQTQRYQNPTRQQYQSSRQYQSSSYRGTSQVQSYQNPARQQDQSSRQYQSSSYRGTPQVQRVQSQSQQRYQAPQISTPRFSGGSSFSRGGSSGFGRGISSGFSQGGSSSFSRGGSSGFSRGGSGGFSRGSGGGFSRGTSSSFSRGSGGGFSRGTSSSFSRGGGRQR